MFGRYLQYKITSSLRSDVIFTHRLKVSPDNSRYTDAKRELNIYYSNHSAGVPSRLFILMFNNIDDSVKWRFVPQIMTRKKIRRRFKPQTAQTGLNIFQNIFFSNTRAFRKWLIEHHTIKIHSNLFYLCHSAWIRSKTIHCWHFAQMSVVYSFCVGRIFIVVAFRQS